MEAKVLSVDTVDLYLNKTNPPHLAVFATGTVNSSGWKNGRLVPWVYVDPPQDGIQDFEFVAETPSGIVLWKICPIEGSAAINFVDWMKGVRIHASSNNKEALLSNEHAGARWVNLGGEIPWPFDSGAQLP